MTVTVVCPDDRDVNVLSSALEKHYSDASVGSIQSNRHPMNTTTVGDLLASMTDKQLQAVELAYYSGYFERLREHNTTEIASKFGVSRGRLHSISTRPSENSSLESKTRVVPSRASFSRISVPSIQKITCVC